MDGLTRTKDDIIKSQVTDLFKAANFEDVIIRAYKVREKLDALGCFKNIEIYIDTSQGPDASPDGVEVGLNNYTNYTKLIRQSINNFSDLNVTQFVILICCIMVYLFIILTGSFIVRSPLQYVS